MEWPEDVNEDFVDHAEAKSYADGGANPIQIKTRGIAVPVRRKHDGKRQELGDDVSEEIPEFAMNAVSEHGGAGPRLNQGMRKPERVVQDSDSFAHRHHLKRPPALQHTGTTVQLKRS